MKKIFRYTGLGPVSMPRGGKTGMGFFVMKPGVNEIDQKDWDFIKEHPDFAKMIEMGKSNPLHVNEKNGMGVIVVIGGESEKSDENGQKGSSSLGSMKADEAKAMVLETFDAALLRKWKEEETRKGVSSAIDAQLDAIQEERDQSKDKENKE